MIRKSLVISLSLMVVASMGLCLAQTDTQPPQGRMRGPRPGMLRSQGVQGPQAILESFDRLAKALPDELKLASYQAPRFKTLADEHRKTLEELVKKIEAENKKFDSEMERLLTAEQQTKYQELKKRNEQGPMMGGRMGMGAALNDLNLTPEKKSQVEKIMRESREKIRANRGNPQAREAAVKEMQDQLKLVLTPEEYQKLSERMPMGRGPRGPGGM